jgi:glutaredoxin 3
MPNLVLYHATYCPYCIKVTNYLKDQGISVALKDTAADQMAREELIAKTGRTQVPCLFIDDEVLFESNDIIEWFKANHTA